jgi:hypothetical protein
MARGDEQTTGVAPTSIASFDQVIGPTGLLRNGVEGVLGTPPDQESLEIASTSVASSTSPEAANLTVPSDATK